MKKFRLVIIPRRIIEVEAESPADALDKTNDQVKDDEMVFTVEQQPDKPSKDNPLANAPIDKGPK